MNSDIHVSKETRQISLLENLSSVSGVEGVLYIYIESLPIYLSTSIAFNIFNIKLKNYPRAIIWRSTNKEVKNTITSANVSFDIDYYKNPEKFVTKHLEYKPNTSKIDFIPKKEEVIIQKPSTPDYLHKTSSSIEDAFQNGKEYDFTNIFEVSSEVTDQKDIFENRPNDPSVDKRESVQDFDKWVNKIEATKHALDRMKEQEPDRIRVAGEQYIANETKTKKPKIFFFMSTIFSAAIGLMATLIMFPSTIYTITITPPEIEDSLIIAVRKDIFESRGVNLTESITKPTSGSGNLQTTRAIGKLKLFNNTDKPVLLPKGEYVFGTEENQYVLLSNQTLPDTITIPNTNTEELVLPIQAVNPGKDFELQDKAKMDILNLLGQQICESCYGQTVGATTISQAGGAKSVSEADRDVLRSAVDSAIAQKRIKAYSESGTTKEFSYPTWFKNEDSKFEFDHNIGDKADELKLSVEVKTKLFYLPRTSLIDIIKKQKDEIDEVVDIEIKNPTGSFSEDEEITIPLYYRYTTKSEINKQKVTDILKNEKNTTVSQAVIQNEFPSVKKISNQETGIRIPGLKPKVTVNFVNPKTVK
jgi:hypothetical protein